MYFILTIVLTPQPLKTFKGCVVIVFTHDIQMDIHAVGLAGGQSEKFCPGCISESMRYRVLILGRDIVWGVGVEHNYATI